ncbi:hypothetical protein JKF63_05172 [Porcisia hertigi]|uniref:Uncharacterized protein n=1 Tax=Porcisia hertigi TaxID=2761500 RepID=A0A836LB76_9TRYP|nr:hypothetical protein JKF63_05172 [Porcisia hertigi]
MATSKGSADQSRKFGLKESREQYQQRRKEEKHLKWTNKLSKEDLGKLQTELDSLNRARFLAPQQNERKRLVQRMIRDLEATENEKSEVMPTVAPTQSTVDSDSDDDLLFSKDTVTNDEHKRLFVPRSVRRKPEIKPSEEKKSSQRLAENAEKELLAAVHDDDNTESFLDSLL